MPIEIRSPMSGIVREILVTTGDNIRNGQEIFILESMKMETPVEADCDGKVESVTVTVDQSVSEGDVLLNVSQ